VKRDRTGATRHALLERAAVAAGNDWVQRLSRELLAERRVAAGGWPGTLSEARTWARSYVHRVLSELVSSTPATADELENAARATYAHARSKWLAGARREEDPSDRKDITEVGQ
jgi:hypothetical protein